MPYPTKYARQYDFQGYQVSNPTRPLPGDKVNVDLNAVKQSVDEIVEFLKGPIRSDGKLANGSVGVDQLNPNLNLGFSLPTVWEAHVDYTADSTVLYANKFWKSKAAHTSSGGFDESKWDEIVDFGAQADAAAASAAAALASENAAEASAEDAAADRVQTGLDVVATAADRVQTGLDVVATAADRVQTGVDAAAAAAAFDSFDDRYLGAKASDPTLDNDGGALLVGALHWSTVASALKVYDGAAWQNYGASPGTDLSGVTDTEAARDNLGLAQIVSFASFNPAADGVTDDTAILNSAIDYVSSVKGKLIIPPGDYLIDGAVLKSNIHIEFQPGAQLIQPDAGSVTAGHVLVGTGTVNTGAAVALTGDVTTGGASVSVAAGAESIFSVGDHVLIYDDDYVFTPAVAGRNQEIIVVSSVSSGVVNFSRYLTSVYTTANNAKIAPITPLKNVRISGYGEITVGLNRSYGIRMTYPVDCLVEHVLVRRSRGGGSFVFQTGFNSHIRGVTARDGQSPGTGGTGYGVSFDESCLFCSVTESFFENLRECTYTNRTRWCTFSENICSNIIDSGWNCHGAGSDNNVCRDNIFRDCSQAVAVGWSGATRADSYNLVEGNYIYRCANGISISGNSTGPITGTGNVARGNRIRSCSSRGVSVAYQSAFTVADNVIDDSASLSNGIYVVAGCALGNISGNRILNITTAGATGIRVDAATDVMVSHNVVNRMTGASATGFYVPAGNTDVRVQLNAAMDHGTVSLAGAAVNTLNTWN